MFFTLSKIISPFLAPLNLVFLILVLGFVVRIFSKALGKSLLVFGMAFFIVSGIIPTGYNGLVFLEEIYKRPPALPERVDGILVLGGATATDISDKREALALNDSSERIIEAMMLARKYPQAIIIFSGGNGQLGQHYNRTEAQDTAMLLQDLGFPMENVFFEDRSRTTYENIRFSRDMFMPQPEETWILVTSAFHMPRAIGVAQRQNWINLIPYPVDYRTTGKYGWLPFNADLLGNMYKLQIALHEYAGLAGYQLAGKISLPLH